MDDHARTQFLGEKTIGRYGCFGCHTIGGFEKTSPIGVELTEEGIEAGRAARLRLRARAIPHTLPGWIHRKLMEPRVFDRDKIKKPRRAAPDAEVPLRARGGRRHRDGGAVLHEGAGAPRRPEAARGRRAIRREGSAPRAQPELPGLPRQSERAARSARSSRASSRASGGEVHPGPGPLAAHSLQRQVARSARDRASRPPGFTTSSVIRRTTSAPGSRCGCPPSTSPRKRTTPSPTTSRPWTRSPTPTSRSPPRTRRWRRPARISSTKWQCVKCHVVAGQAAQPGAGQHGPRPRQGSGAPAGRLDLAVAHRPRQDHAGNPHAVELPGRSPGERLSRRSWAAIRRSRSRPCAPTC